MKILTFLKNMALFLISPVIALAYIIALPIVGLYSFINLSVERGLKEVSDVKLKINLKRLPN